MNKQTQMMIFGAVAAVIVLAVVAFFLFSGTGGNGDTVTTPPPQPIGLGGEPFQPAQLGSSTGPLGGAAPGTPQTIPPSMTTKPVEESPIVARKDPFALLPQELEVQQVGAYELAGFYRAAGTPKPPKPPVVEVYEPQPYRRVAGIIEGQTISAILEQEGELTQIVKPGDTVGEFRVASIDMAGITLKRSKGNPRMVRVPYEPPAGGTGSGTGGGGGDRRGGFEGGGMPGAGGIGGGAAPGGPPGRGGRGGRGGMDL